MSKLNLVVVSGNLSAPSKTLGLASQITEAIQRLTPVDLHIHQLAELAPVFGPARNPLELTATGHAVLRSIENADLLIAVTPVYKGAYTGAFKHLLDFLDPKALTGIPVILGATGGGEKHALIIEHQLRPLFGFFSTQTVATGIYATEQHYDGARFKDSLVLERIEAAAREGVALAQLRLGQTPLARAA